MEESDMIGETLGNLLRAASQRMSDEEMISFGKLRTDSERMGYVLNQKHVHEMLVVEPDYPGKSLEKALKFKEEGNKLFSLKSYVSSLREYNKCLRYIPTDEPLGVALIAVLYANRSACLLHIRRFEQCLRDTDLALEEGYPKEMQYKIFDRRGRCYTQMRNSTQAKVEFEKAIELLGVSKLDDTGKEKWKKTLQKEIALLVKVAEKTTVESAPPVPSLQGRPNAVYPHVSEAVTFSYNDKHGRHAVANANIHIGDVIGQEDSYVSVLLPHYYHSHCYHCLAQLSAPIPCTKTHALVFCNKACRQKAWDNYLKFEYRYLNLLGAHYCAKIGHLALRLVMHLGVDKIKDAVLKDDKEWSKKERMDIGMTPDGVYSSEYDSIFRMETNMSGRLPEGMYDFSIFAVCLLKLLQGSGFFEGIDEAKESVTHSKTLVTVGSALLRHLFVIQCNARGVTEIQDPVNFEKQCPDSIGVGIYPTVALFNHSCDPNADLNFYDSRVFIRANRQISKGEGINIDYGLVFYLNTMRERQAKLQYRYCFMCACVACREKWGLWRDLEAEIPQFKCERCGRALPMGGKLIEKAYLRCDKCNTLQNLQEPMNRLGVSHDVFAAAVQEAVNGNYQVALPGLQNHLGLMQSLLLPPWRDLVSAQSAIRQCYRSMANIREII